MTHPGQRFNPPPGWPPAQPGWTPPEGWTPPAEWPPPPPGWRFWTPALPARSGSWVGRHKVLTAVLGVLLLIIVIGVAAGGGTKKSPNAGAQSPAAPVSNAPSKKRAPQKTAARIGQPVRDGKFQFVVTKVQPGVAQVGTADFGQKAQGQFVFVYVTVTNIGNEARTFDGSSQILFDAAVRKYSADSGAAIYLDQSQSFLNDVNPGNAVKGIVVFDMPKGVSPVVAELHDSPFSGGVKVSLT